MKYITILSIFLLFFSSCKDEGISFGTVDYYPDFLWIDSQTMPVQKTLEFDFSQDAKNDKTSFAEFQFVDNNGLPFGTDVLDIKIDGKTIKDNKIKVGSNISKLILSLSFTPNAKEGKYQGYLRLINHNLDRLDSQLLGTNETIDAFQWTLYYNKRMNPLAKTLLWIIVAMAICLCIWFIFIQPILYPHFKKFSKSIQISKNGRVISQMNYSFKGARRVVFYDRKIEQSKLNRFFLGEIKTLVNPVFRNKLSFTPRKKDAVVHGVGYTINPNPILRNGISTITDIQEKITITLH